MTTSNIKTIVFKLQTQPGQDEKVVKIPSPMLPYDTFANTIIIPATIIHFGL
jgi:hypothetical protein